MYMLLSLCVRTRTQNLCCTLTALFSFTAVFPLRPITLHCTPRCLPVTVFWLVPLKHVTIFPTWYTVSWVPKAHPRPLGLMASLSGLILETSQYSTKWKKKKKKLSLLATIERHLNTQCTTAGHVLDPAGKKPETANLALNFPKSQSDQAPKRLIYNILVLQTTAHYLVLLSYHRCVAFLLYIVLLTVVNVTKQLYGVKTTLRSLCVHLIITFFKLD